MGLNHKLARHLDTYPAEMLDGGTLRTIVMILAPEVQKYEAELAAFPKDHPFRQEFIDLFAEDLAKCRATIVACEAEIERRKGEG